MKTRDPYGISDYKDKKALEQDKEEKMEKFMSEMIKEVRRISSAVERLEREMAKK